MPASVLVAICGEHLSTVMTKKSTKLRIHAGEISFPGGKPEKPDVDLLDTAIREAREETGLRATRGHVLARLDDVRTLTTGYVITPYVCLLEDGCGGLRTNGEVERIYEPRLPDLLETRRINPKYNSVEFSTGGHTVWGASARILEQLRILFEGAET